MSNVEKTIKDIGTEVEPSDVEVAATATAPSLGRSDDSKEENDKNVAAILPGDVYKKLNQKPRWALGFNRYWAAPPSIEEIPAGLYRCYVSSENGPTLEPQVNNIDEIIELPDSIISSVVDEFKTFWGRKKEFSERGFLHKRGFLFYGPPGTGKTCTIQIMIREIIEKLGGIVVFIEDANVGFRCLRMLRKIENTRPVIVILEDLDALTKKFGESDFLSLLDGESQIGSVVFVATTNYITRLAKRFVDRPSRFDTIVQIGYPTERDRRVFLKHKEPSLTPEELELWVKESHGFTFAHLKEMIVSIKCIGKGFEETVKNLRDMITVEHKDDGADSPLKAKVSMGFGSN